MLCSPLGTLYLFFSCFAALLLKDKGHHDRKHGVFLLLLVGKLTSNELCFDLNSGRQMFLHLRILLYLR